MFNTVVNNHRITVIKYMNFIQEFALMWQNL